MNDINNINNKKTKLIDIKKLKNIDNTDNDIIMHELNKNNNKPRKRKRIVNIIDPNNISADVKNCQKTLLNGEIYFVYNFLGEEPINKPINA